MELNEVFVDTSMFKALVDEKDDFHAQGVAIWGKLKEQKTLLITSNYILDETFTLLRLRRGRSIIDILRQSLAEDKVKIVRVTVADETGAWDWFLNDWSKLSFTDCVSFAMIKRLEIHDVAAFDEHFERAGFKLLA